MPSSNPDADGITHDEFLGPQSPEPTPVEIIPLDDINDLPTIPLPAFDLRKKIPFYIRPFIGMLPEVINKIPWDADGIKYYFVEKPEDEYFCGKYKDGCCFVINTSRRKGFCGIRHMGKC